MKDFLLVMAPKLEPYTEEEIQAAMDELLVEFRGTVPKPAELIDATRRRRARHNFATVATLDTGRKPPSRAELEIELKARNAHRAMFGMPPLTMADVEENP